MTILASLLAASLHVNLPTAATGAESILPEISFGKKASPTSLTRDGGDSLAQPGLRLEFESLRYNWTTWPKHHNSDCRVVEAVLVDAWLVGRVECKRHHSRALTPPPPPSALPSARSRPRPRYE